MIHTRYRVRKYYTGSIDVVVEAKNVNEANAKADDEIEAMGQDKFIEELTGSLDYADVVVEREEEIAVPPAGVPS